VSNVRSELIREGEAPAKPQGSPTRKHPAHGVRSDNERSTIVFLTLCSKDRQPWLADEQVHRLLRKVWSEADAWLVGRYVIMPDHIHLFASPNSSWKCKTPTEPPSFDNWVRYWKSQFTKIHGDASHRWQTDHWDRRLRSQESYADKWDYVRNNPVRHGLIGVANEWPYQGKLHDLIW
jgi:putative transposase